MARRNMSAMNRAKSEIIYHDEGVLATRSAAGFFVHLSRPIAACHQLRIVAALWEVWLASRSEVRGADVEWTIDLSGFGELPLPLIAVISAMDADLRQDGHKPLVVSDRQEGTRLPFPEVVRVDCVGARESSGDVGV